MGGMSTLWSFLVDLGIYLLLSQLLKRKKRMAYYLSGGRYQLPGGKHVLVYYITKRRVHGNGKGLQEVEKRKMRVLCLHGFRTSGSFLRKQISKWDPSIFQHSEMNFPDGMFPAGDTSEIEGIFPPPFFEWFQFNEDFTEYTNLEECISFVCDYIRKNGPFDGLLGFSQGATLSALLIGYQAQGKILKEHPPIKFFVSISGSKFRDPSICDIAYKDPITVPSLHFIGDKDWLKQPSEDLVSAFHNPLILRHPQGHTVPRLDEAAVKKFRQWTGTIFQGSASVDPQETVESDVKVEEAAADPNPIKERCSLESMDASAGIANSDDSIISPLSN